MIDVGFVFISRFSFRDYLGFIELLIDASEKKGSSLLLTLG